MHKHHIIKSGNSTATKALILLHGRGSTAHNILSLIVNLNVEGYAFFAPQATNNSWYPESFLAKPELNEPWLSSALQMLAATVKEIENQGIAAENIYFLGFSQGACLASEFIARNAVKYGGAVIFTGGLIGDKVYNENYKGDFNNTPVFIGTSNPDFHVPVERVYDTVEVLKSMGANVTVKVYDNMGHTISQDEINLANQLVFRN